MKDLIDVVTKVSELGDSNPWITTLIVSIVAVAIIMKFWKLQIEPTSLDTLTPKHRYVRRSMMFILLFVVTAAIDIFMTKCIIGYYDESDKTTGLHVIFCVAMALLVFALAISVAAKIITKQKNEVKTFYDKKILALAVLVIIQLGPSYILVCGIITDNSILYAAIIALIQSLIIIFMLVMVRPKSATYKIKFENPHPTNICGIEKQKKWLYLYSASNDLSVFECGTSANAGNISTTILLNQEEIIGKPIVKTYALEFEDAFSSYSMQKMSKKGKYKVHNPTNTDLKYAKIGIRYYRSKVYAYYHHFHHEEFKTIWHWKRNKVKSIEINGKKYWTTLYLVDCEAEE